MRAITPSSSNTRQVKQEKIDSHFRTNVADPDKLSCLYQAVQLGELQTELKTAGIKCSRKVLAEYLESKGVAFNQPAKRRKGPPKNI